MHTRRSDSPNTAAEHLPDDVPVPEMAQQLVEAPKTVSQDRIQRRTVERIADIPVPKVAEELVEKVLSQDRDQQRSAEEII